MKNRFIFFTLAANQNVREAQYYLGVIYYNNELVKQDINMSLYYFKLAASQNHKQAQYNLGIIYWDGIFVEKNIKKSLFYYECSAKQDFSLAQMIMADFYLEGKYVERNIQESIHLYKEASVSKETYAKNNFGVIFQHGFNTIEKNIVLSKEYFTESIKECNNAVSMYNLANVLLDEVEEDELNEKFNESIDLLIKSSLCNFFAANALICLIFMKKYNTNNLEIIKKEILQNIKIIWYSFFCHYMQQYQKNCQKKYLTFQAYLVFWLDRLGTIVLNNLPSDGEQFTLNKTLNFENVSPDNKKEII